ncbi:MAG: porin [Planctomycetaceae bacterium]|jgi:hypothetical protein|nr:porin [Planctomycetaceae bacterium]
MKQTSLFSIIFIIFVLMFVSGTSQAQHPRDSMLRNSCDEITPCEPCYRVSDNPCGIVDDNCIFGHDADCPQYHKKQYNKKQLQNSVHFYGWLQAGLYVNSHGHKNVYNTASLSPISRNQDMLSGNSYITGTTQHSDLMINQLWIGAEKTLNTKHGWDWGFRSDFSFGTDTKFSQSFSDKSFDYDWGTGDYYTSFVQLYAEIGYKNLKLRAGKFATIMSYEPVPGPLSFFYSHPYFCYSQPLTHTGAIAEYKINDQWTILGGWTAGYHNSFENRFDDNGFLGQIQYKPDSDTKIVYSLYWGDHNGLYRRVDALNYGRAYWTENEITMTLCYTRQINKRWFYMIEGLWSRLNDDGGQIVPDTTRKSYGLNQHLIYTINKKWSVGTRFEWLSGKGTYVDLAPLTGGQGTNLYDITLTANWNITKNINLRPEIRYDWTFYRNGFKPFGGGKNKDQLSGGIAAIVIF